MWVCDACHGHACRRVKLVQAEAAKRHEMTMSTATFDALFCVFSFLASEAQTCSSKGSPIYS